MLLEKFPSLAIPEVTRWVTAGLLHIPLRIHQAQEHRNSWAGAPEEGPPAKESHGLYTPHCPHKSRSSSQVFGSCSISASIHSAGFTALHLLWYPKGQQFQLLLCHPLSVHLAGVTSLSCSLLSQSLATHGLLSQASSQSSVCISICISIFRLSYLDQKYAQQHEEFDRCV